MPKNINEIQQVGEIIGRKKNLDLTLAKKISRWKYSRRFSRQTQPGTSSCNQLSDTKCIRLWAAVVRKDAVVLHSSEWGRYLQSVVKNYFGVTLVRRVTETILRTPSWAWRQKRHPVRPFPAIFTFCQMAKEDRVKRYPDPGLQYYRTCQQWGFDRKSPRAKPLRACLSNQCHFLVASGLRMPKHEISFQSTGPEPNCTERSEYTHQSCEVNWQGDTLMKRPKVPLGCLVVEWWWVTFWWQVFIVLHLERRL